MLTVGSLFSGIGGMELGLERTGGFKTVWQVEIDEYCQKVLAKHWPDVVRHRDIRTVGKHNLSTVDLMCGGFPCQDISQGNVFNPQGLDGNRSGLWSEFYRVICELRPRFVLVENVSALLFRGIGRVLGNLAGIGYDAEWQVLRACDFGLPHRRKRLFIIAYSPSERCIFKHKSKITARNQAHFYQKPQRETQINKVVLLRNVLSQAESMLSEPSICGVDDGVPSWMDRIKGLGNAVVPQITEYIGNCILQSLNTEVGVEK